MSSITKKDSNYIYIAYLAIGGILGDIGTSPLYVMLLTFKLIPITKDNIMGVLSLIVWSFLFLSLKYAWIALNLDNKGEGGTYALLNLITNTKEKMKIKKYKWILILATFLSMLCGALLLSDGIITPSISVLAAIEGIDVVYPNLQHLILPLAILILTGLFSIQKHGTEKIAKFFSPIMILWFISISTCGIISLLKTPWLLKAINPYYGISFIYHHPISVVFATLGYVVLCITGGEALYADEAHYSKPGIRIAWGFASICLIINYFGQGAYILTTHNASRPFFGMSLIIGHFLYIYMLILATLAAIIASQAMITGAFSTYSQAMELGMFPRLEVKNTSTKLKGQIYLPIVNRIMFIACIATVLIFKSSDKLGDAYGLAVTGAFIGTTLMMNIYFFFNYNSDPSKLLVFQCIILFFLCFDSSFFAANVEKIPTGGWFPLIIASGLIFTMFSWKKGTKHLFYSIPKEKINQIYDLIDSIKPSFLLGTDIYMTANSQIIPATLLQQLKNGAIKKQLVITTIKTTANPWGVIYHKELIKSYNNGEVNLYRVIIEKGYMKIMLECFQHLKVFVKLWTNVQKIMSVWLLLIMQNLIN
jgi:KUP system potassium uptake protein